MLRLGMILSVCVVTCWGVPHEKIADIFADIDYNRNDVINQNEVLAFFAEFKIRPSDESISKDKFVKVWMQKYHDTSAVAGNLYERLDANGDTLLADSDVPVLFSKVDKNHSKVIEWAEFEATFNAWYQNM